MPRRTGVAALRRTGVAALWRCGVPAYRRCGVAAYRRTGVAAYRRTGGVASPVRRPACGGCVDGRALADAQRSFRARRLRDLCAPGSTAKLASCAKINRLARPSGQFGRLAPVRVAQPGLRDLCTPGCAAKLASRAKINRMARPSRQFGHSDRRTVSCRDFRARFRPNITTPDGRGTGAGRTGAGAGRTGAGAGRTGAGTGQGSWQRSGLDLPRTATAAAGRGVTARRLLRRAARGSGRVRPPQLPGSAPGRRR